MFDLDELFPDYAFVTSAYVSDALKDFPLRLSAGKDNQWLAHSIRRAMNLAAILNSSKNPITKAEFPELRDDLFRLAESAGRTWQELFEILPISKTIDDDSRMEKSRKMEHFLMDFAFMHSGVDPSEENIDSTAYARFRKLVSELEWASSFLLAAAQTVPVKRGRSASDEPVLRVQFLAAIFEAAFETKATANQFPSNALHKAPTNFMKFCELFGELSHSNFKDTVIKGLAQHRRAPLSFPDGLL